jgi:hypothetical protein
MKDKFIKYYPFWLGLIACIELIGMSVKYDMWSFSVLIAYIVGYFKLTKFN